MKTKNFEITTKEEYLKRTEYKLKIREYSDTLYTFKTKCVNIDLPDIDRIILDLTDIAYEKRNVNDLDIDMLFYLIETMIFDYIVKTKIKINYVTFNGIKNVIGDTKIITKL